MPVAPTKIAKLIGSALAVLGSAGTRGEGGAWFFDTHWMRPIRQRLAWSVRWQGEVRSCLNCRHSFTPQ
jgi:hypothetical protein